MDNWLFEEIGGELLWCSWRDILMMMIGNRTETHQENSSIKFSEIFS